MNNNKEKEAKNRIHTACEPHLDKYFPKTNYDDPSKPSTGKRAEALALYGLMIGEFLSELQRRENEVWKEASDMVLKRTQIVPPDPLDMTFREQMNQPINLMVRPYISNEEAVNRVLSDISSTLLSQVKENK